MRRWITPQPGPGYGMLGVMGTLGKRWSPLDLERARQLYDSGLSFSELGQRLGYSGSYLARRFKAAGLRTRPEGRHPAASISNPDPSDIVTRREAGQTFTAIAEALGISRDVARDRYLKATRRPRRST